MQELIEEKTESHLPRIITGMENFLFTKKKKNWLLTHFTSNRFSLFASSWLYPQIDTMSCLAWLSLRSQSLLFTVPNVKLNVSPNISV